METTVNKPQPVENQSSRDNLFKRIVDGLLGRNKQAVNERRMYALGGKNPAENTIPEVPVNPEGAQNSPAATENNFGPKISSPVDQRGIGY